MLGRTGKRSAKCGRSTLPTGGGPWTRTDGLPVADDITELTTQGARVPIIFDERGDRETGWTFTGTALDGTAGENCNNWSAVVSGADEVCIGHSPKVSESWTCHSTYQYCDTSRHLYCFER